MRKVSLPKDSPRGGVLTHASVLLVTSNPTRTSPVKRGQFILENILGTPAPPPPADVPPLEESKKDFKDRRADRPRAAGPASRRARLCTRATRGWTRWGLRSKTSMRWACGATKERGQPIDATGQAASPASRSTTCAS